MLKGFFRDECAGSLQRFDYFAIGIAKFSVIGNDARSCKLRNVIVINAVRANRIGYLLRARCCKGGTMNKKCSVVVRAMTRCGVDESGARVISYVVGPNYRDIKVVASPPQWMRARLDDRGMNVHHSLK